MKKAIRESHYRSLIKGISWRAVGTLDTMMIAFIVTGHGVTAVSIGGIEIFTKITLYYFHERIWQIIPRGRVRRWFGSAPTDKETLDILD